MLELWKGGTLDRFPDHLELEQHFNHVRLLYAGVVANQPAGPTWLGSALHQFPWDCWLYQEWLWKDRPKTLVECGTASGRTTEYLAWVTRQTGTPGARVITIDLRPVHDGRKLSGENIDVFTGIDATSPATVSLLSGLNLLRPPVAVTLDTEHTRDHVLAQMRAWAPVVSRGQMLVVQDTWEHVHNGQWRDHALGAVEAFMAENHDFVIDLWPQRWVVTQSPFGWLRRVK